MCCGLWDFLPWKEKENQIEPRIEREKKKSVESSSLINWDSSLLIPTTVSVSDSSLIRHLQEEEGRRNSKLTTPPAGNPVSSSKSFKISLLVS